MRKGKIRKRLFTRKKYSCRAIKLGEGNNLYFLLLLSEEEICEIYWIKRRIHFSINRYFDSKKII